MTPGIFNVQRFCTHDGPGTRTVIFLKGCPLRCWWCSNPESQCSGQEMLFDPKKCMGCGLCLGRCGASIPLGQQGRAKGCTLCGACAAVCPTGALELVGRPREVAELVAEAARDELYYRDGGGVTISGGEPLLFPDFVCSLAGELRRQGYHVALETTGFSDWETAEHVYSQMDLILYDIKQMDDDKHRLYTGVSNRPVLDNARRALAAGLPLRIRVPLMGGLNDDEEHIRRLEDFCRDTGACDVEFLPYHSFGESKYALLGREYRCEAFTPPPERRRELAGILEAVGVRVKIGQ